MTSSTSDANTCANCFAEFDWEPFTQDGVDFCCAGCADGGPCICTYDGAPHVTAATTGVAVLATTGTSGESSNDSDADADLSDEPAAQLPGSDGDGGEPPDEPPAPDQTPEEEEEPPTNGRLAVILAAVSEMPLPVQEVVTARLSTEGTDEEIGERLGLTGEEVRELIVQGQAILDRSLGLDFTIRYIAISDVADEEEPEPEFPSFDDDFEQTDEEYESEHDVRASDLGQLIANSVDSLTRASADERTDDDAKKTLSEALREAGNLFRLASERLLADSPPDGSLRAAMADTRDDDESITLVVENPGDVNPLMMALQAADSVRVVQLESLTKETAVFRLAISSMMGLVRELMSQEGRIRPARLQMAADEITIELPVVEAEIPASATGAAAHPSGERYELSVDSFFGARHFIESGDNVGPPHHHSYRVEAGFVSAQPDRQGFVLGFAHVRELVESTVMNYSETLLNTEDPFLELPPTTENLAKVFHQKITGKLRELAQASVQLKHVRVWESPSNSATYTDFGNDAAITA